jgi:hypothetical protein
LVRKTWEMLPYEMMVLWTFLACCKRSYTYFLTSHRSCKNTSFDGELFRVRRWAERGGGQVRTANSICWPCKWSIGGFKFFSNQKLTSDSESAHKNRSEKIFYNDLLLVTDTFTILGASYRYMRHRGITIWTIIHQC